jgi:multimeric flavodoxin WrbA
MTIIFYYSVTGTNASIAQTIGADLNAEIREIRSVRKYSFLGMVFGSRMKRRFPIQPMEMDLSRYDSLVLCAPVWAGGPACQMMTFIDKAELRGKKVAVVFGCGALQPARALGIIRAALEAKGAMVVAGEILDVGKFKGEALTKAAKELAVALTRKLS